MSCTFYYRIVFPTHSLFAFPLLSLQFGQSYLLLGISQKVSCLWNLINSTCQYQSDHLTCNLPGQNHHGPSQLSKNIKTFPDIASSSPPHLFFNPLWQVPHSSSKSTRSYLAIMHTQVHIQEIWLLPFYLFLFVSALYLSFKSHSGNEFLSCFFFFTTSRATFIFSMLLISLLLLLLTICLCFLLGFKFFEVQNYIVFCLTSA